MTAFLKVHMLLLNDHNCKISFLLQERESLVRIWDEGRFFSLIGW
jgi:hypothetical protein